VVGLTGLSRMTETDVTHCDPCSGHFYARFFESYDVSGLSLSPNADPQRPEEDR